MSSLINIIYDNLFSLKDLFFIDYMANKMDILRDNMLIMSKDFHISHEHMESLTLGQFDKKLARANHLNKEFSKAYGK